jgi:hypothetical protein
MRVKQLAKLLEQFPPESTVLLAHDSKGNELGELTGFDVGTMIEGSPGPLNYTTIRDNEKIEDTNCVVFYTIER